MAPKKAAPKKAAKALPVRQGDVLLRPISALPPGAKRVPTGTGPIVLAFGIATGHAHQIEGAGAELHELDGQRFVALAGSARLVHTSTLPVEHETIPLVRGVYHVIRQVSLTDAGVLPVED